MKNLLRLKPVLKPYYLQILLALIVLLILTAISIVIPAIIRAVIDFGITGGEYKFLRCWRCWLAWCRGLSMKFLFHTDIVALKAFFLGLMTFNWQPLPVDVPLLVHLTLVATLMIVFPVSKLQHAPGVFFSPTRNQVDNSREKRWVAGWSAKIDNTKAAGG